jgi:hypothetical protein
MDYTIQFSYLLTKRHILYLLSSFYVQGIYLRNPTTKYRNASALDASHQSFNENIKQSINATPPNGEWP